MHIFVGNLALTTTEQDLRERFEPYGSVDAIRIMTDRETGRSRGCGFVEMPDSHAAQTAMDALNGTSLAGRVLTVNEARPREPRREPRQPRWEANASRRVVMRWYGHGSLQRACWAIPAPSTATGETRGHGGSESWSVGWIVQLSVASS